MPETVLYPGFVGVSAFTTSICQPSSVGDALRFRGVDVIDLAGNRPYDDVWRLLVDDDFGSGPLADISDSDVVAALDSPGLPRLELQRMILRLGASRGMEPTRGADASALRDDLALLSMAYSVGLGALLSWRTGRFVSHLGDHREMGVAQRLVRAWRGDPDAETVRVVNSLLSTVAEHGTSASTFTTRVVASTGADAAACVTAGLCAIGGPRHGGATRGVTTLLREISGDPGAATTCVERLLDEGRRLPGMGHRVYRVRDPREPILRSLAESVDAPLIPAAEAYQRAAETVLVERKGPGRKLPANPDLWLPVVLDGIGVPDEFMDAFLAGARIAGWSAHCVEQVSSGGPLLRPDDIYAGR